MGHAILVFIFLAFIGPLAQAQSTEGEGRSSIPRMSTDDQGRLYVDGMLLQHFLDPQSPRNKLRTKTGDYEVTVEMQGPIPIFDGKGASPSQDKILQAIPQIQEWARGKKYVILRILLYGIDDRRRSIGKIELVDESWSVQRDKDDRLVAVLSSATTAISAPVGPKRRAFDDAFRTENGVRIPIKLAVDMWAQDRTPESGKNKGMQMAEVRRLYIIDRKGKHFLGSFLTSFEGLDWVIFQASQ